MTFHDRNDQRESALAALRREADRYLQQISDDASALEMMTLERERAERRAERAERSLSDLEVALRRREVEVAALEREVAQLRGRPSGKKAQTAG
jgi:hypothetical protein